MTLLCDQCRCGVFPGSDTGDQYRTAGGNLDDAHYVGGGKITGRSSGDTESSAAESHVLYCIRLQGCLCDETLVLGTSSVDSLFLGVYTGMLFPGKLDLSEAPCTFCRCFVTKIRVKTVMSVSDKQS